MKIISKNIKHVFPSDTICIKYSWDTRIRLSHLSYKRKDACNQAYTIGCG